MSIAPHKPFQSVPVKLHPHDLRTRPSRLQDVVGNTPLLALPRLAEEVAPVEIYGKAEWFNPGGSVKDRPALNMLLEGERSGALTQDKTILDATSGNTGIAYATFGAAMGYRVRLCVPSSIGLMQRRILSAYGTELIETPAQRGSDGAIEEAIRIYRENPDAYFYPDQYSNDANWRAHYHGTGPELINQTEGRLTHYVAGLGTTGTFGGTGRRLREYDPSIRLISFQPDSPLHGLEGMKHMPTSLKPAIYDEGFADENRWVQTEAAQSMVKRLAREEGILVGLSAGAAAHAALEVARELTEGVVVTVLADSALKYFDQLFW